MRFWRNTSAATLPLPADTLTLPLGTLGYEWDAAPDNGFRPAGLMHLSDADLHRPGRCSRTTATTYASGHRHAPSDAVPPRHARSCSAPGTVQWSWGLDANHDFTARSPRASTMQQATVNLFADMGVQPGSLMAGLIPASRLGRHHGARSTISVSGRRIAPGDRARP